MFSSFEHLATTACKLTAPALNTSVFGIVAGACYAPLPVIGAPMNQAMTHERDLQGSRFGTFANERPEMFHFAHPLRM